jgi:chromosome segregation protein
MSGGSRAGRESGFLSRRLEIEENRGKLAALEKEREKLLADKESIIADITASGQKQAAEAARINELNLTAAKITAQCGEAEKSEKLLNTGLATLSFECGENERAAAELAELKTELERAGQEARETDERKHGLAEELAQRSVVWTKEKDELHRRRNDAEVRQETARGAAELLLEQHSLVQSEWERLSLEEERRAAELAALRGGIAAAQGERADAAALIEQKNAELAEQRKREETLLSERLELLPEQNRLDKEAKDLRHNLQATQNRLNNAEAIFARYDTEFSLTRSQLSDTHGLTLDEAQAFYREDLTDKELAEKTAAVQEALSVLPPVNPLAIAEYESLKERCDFLSAQYGDLLRAKEDLINLIKDIDRTMAKRFREAFGAISDYFQTTFTRLFGGGSASLKLLDSADVLTSGIDIVVQPPGKKLQLLSLLSGGERALTVIALLFAMLSYRPAPFCVLDEVDAALDEANAGRFVSLLTDYAKGTQFIIITHRKATMRAAELLHGITMEESGVSKLISIKLLEKDGVLL